MASAEYAARDASDVPGDEDRWALLCRGEKDEAQETYKLARDSIDPSLSVVSPTVSWTNGREAGPRPRQPGGRADESDPGGED